MVIRGGELGKRQIAGTILTVLLCVSIFLPIIAVPTYGYDDYEEWYVDPQNPEVQKMIRDYCAFPLEANLMYNARSLFMALSARFCYDYTFVHAWQTIPEILRQRKGVCCDFARLYYSLLRGIGWPEHRIQLVWGPVYDLLGNFINYHAWVEIKAPSPYGTSLSFSANESIETLKGEQLVMGFNNTFATSPVITEERIQEVRTLGWGERDGWIPLDPTVGVGIYQIPLIGWLLVPFFWGLFLTFGYHVYLLGFWNIPLNEVEPYYGPGAYNPRRENPTWESFTVTVQPYQSFNISYLHDVELYTLRPNIVGSVNSTAPIDFQASNPRLQVIDAASGVTSHDVYVYLGFSMSPIFPKNLGVYWFSVYNPQASPVSVTFGPFGPSYRVGWLGGEETINQTLYNSYSASSQSAAIVPCGQSGNSKSEFFACEDTFAKGIGFPASTQVAIYVLPDGYAPTPTNAKTVTYKTTGTTGVLTATLLWVHTLDLGNYDIWIDTNRNNVFDTGDVFNNQTSGVFAFKVLIPGDANSDGHVNQTDLSYLSISYGSTKENQIWNQYCDFNADLLVDVKDLYIQAKQWTP